MTLERMTGRVLRSIGGMFWVEDQNGISHPASARGLFRLTDQSPKVGDMVDCEPSGDVDRPFLISRIHPRQNELQRPAIANVDILLITISSRQPPPDFLMVDKLMVISLHNGIRPVLILTKTDLTDRAGLELEPYRPAGITLIETSPDHKSGIRQLARLIEGSFACLAGQSGVGKSTVLNRLMQEEVMDVGKVSDRIGRGRHTTREVAFFPCCGGYLADTPGFSTLELEDIELEPHDVVDGFPEIKAVSGNCRFNDCRHLGEPGCAVTTDIIHPERLERYRYLRNRLAEYKKQWIE